MLNLKLQIPFCQKNIPLKKKAYILSYHEEPNTLKRQEYKGKIYVKNINKIM
jgi:hypothetical protein